MIIVYDISGGDCPVLRDLLIHVIPHITDQWYELGLLLLEPKYENYLKTIEGDVRNDSRTCRKMFDKWLTTDLQASWDKVIEALTLIGLDAVGSKIKQQGEQPSTTLACFKLKILILESYISAKLSHHILIRNATNCN